MGEPPLVTVAVRVIGEPALVWLAELPFTVTVSTVAVEVCACTGLQKRAEKTRRLAARLGRIIPSI